MNGPRLLQTHVEYDQRVKARAGDRAGFEGHCLSLLGRNIGECLVRERHIEVKETPGPNGTVRMMGRVWLLSRSESGRLEDEIQTARRQAVYEVTREILEHVRIFGSDYDHKMIHKSTVEHFVAEAVRNFRDREGEKT